MNIEKQVAREAKAMTRAEVIRKALEGKLNWVQAASILRVSPRHMTRLRVRYERIGVDGLKDGRSGRRMPSRIKPKVIEEVCRLKREVYSEFSTKHFHQYLVERHKLRLSYTWVLTILQTRGLVEKAQARGKFRRKRERRPMVGMLVHLDGSTHEWIEGLPMWDLIVALDDADGRMLYAFFVPQEGTVSTLQALEHVLQRYGRFCELYSDRGSHFCRTGESAHGPDDVQQGQVSRVLKTLGIRQILARSPQARGRSERAFGTIQGRLPNELALEGIRSYEQANLYLQKRFVPDFNRRFTVKPAQPESAFVPLVGIDLRLLLSIQHERTVKHDNTVRFEGMDLQLPKTNDRPHFVRCPVLVHELLDGNLAISFHGRLLAAYTRAGLALSHHPLRRGARV